MKESRILECVPNFSVGKDQNSVEAIACAISNVPDVKLLDVDKGINANRTVFTFAGKPDNVVAAAIEAAKVAFLLIDMRTHSGTHPRIGALDVCPFIPISGISMAEAVQLSVSFAQQVAALGVPVYLYEESATKPERKNLAWLRKGEYEGLSDKIKKTDFYPDFGDAVFNAKSGICITGARNFLIAYNINLHTKNVEVAKKIAAEIRQTSTSKYAINGVKAIGWYIAEFDKVQVSTNIVNMEKAPVYKVFDTVCELAKLYDTNVTGSELVGMIPMAALTDTGKYAIEKQGNTSALTDLELCTTAAQYLGLNDVKTFHCRQKVIEMALEKC